MADWVGLGMAELKDRYRRGPPVAARSGDGLLSGPIAGARPGHREPLFMPHSGRCPTPAQRAQVGGQRTLPTRGSRSSAATAPCLAEVTALEFAIPAGNRRSLPVSQVGEVIDDSRHVGRGNRGLVEIA